MKKVYMKPKMEAYKMEAINMVCDSPGVMGGTPATPGKPVLAPGMPDFDEDDIITWE